MEQKVSGKPFPGVVLTQRQLCVMLAVLPLTNHKREHDFGEILEPGGAGSETVY